MNADELEQYHIWSFERLERYLLKTVCGLFYYNGNNFITEKS